MATCRCGASWKGRRTAHCGRCHRTFSSVAAFDLHRSADGEHGACLDPEVVLNRDGARVLFFRGEMWRPPEMSDEAKNKLKELAA